MNEVLNKNGKISIIMGIYNCAKTLSVAIDSILNQSYTNWQLIMCDDSSTDGTYNIAKSYQEKYPDKIILIRNDVNRRLAYSLNQCLKYADGEFIARMDGDDISLPNRFEVQINYLKNHPEYDLVGCTMQRFNDKSGLADIVYSVDSPDYYTLKNKIPFHHATILVRRNVYDTLSGYTVCKRTNRSQDYDLWFRFFYVGFKGQNLQEVLYLVREDISAIRRRTFKTRFNTLKTTWYGYKLLGYPKSWLIKPTLEVFIKSLVPHKFIEVYRKWQALNK